MERGGGSEGSVLLSLLLCTLWPDRCCQQPLSLVSALEDFPGTPSLCSFGVQEVVYIPVLDAAFPHEVSGSSVLCPHRLSLSFEVLPLVEVLLGKVTFKSISGRHSFCGSNIWPPGLMHLCPTIGTKQATPLFCPPNSS